MAPMKASLEAGAGLVMPILALACLRVCLVRAGIASGIGRMMGMGSGVEVEVDSTVSRRADWRRGGARGAG